MKRRGRRIVLGGTALAGLCAAISGSASGPSGAGDGPRPYRSPQSGRSAHFIFVGDTGTGDARARRVAGAIHRHAANRPVSHIFFLGDNVYEEGNPRLIGPRFLDVYRAVLSLGVAAHAALGNHDVQHCRDSGLRPIPRYGSAYAAKPDCWARTHLATPEFGYRGSHRYYSVAIPGDAQPLREHATPLDGGPLVEVFVLDTNTLGSEQTRLERETDAPQLHWLSAALGTSGARWKVVAMHHPMYAPVRCRWLGFGCRGDDEVLRRELEPIFREHGVDAVFQAHQHLYARMKPQRGVRYFVTGAGGKKPDSFRPDPRLVWRPDRGAFNHFVAVHASEADFGFRAVDAEGSIRDHGSLRDP
ncbi:MAG: metallophosphoesterase [Acidobacteria bacterium]|nr:metallophosphoesterase [Acidobacteriota bacterium]